MNILQKKLNKCTECPFEDYEINWYDKNTGCGKLGAHIYPESDNSVMVVGQNPSHRRWKGTHSMEGKQGDIFREIFEKKHLVFTNFIQISTPDNKVDKLTNEQINHCIDHLIDEIKYIKPKLIIIASAFAKDRLFILKRTADIIRTDAYVRFVKHPDYFMTYHKKGLPEYINELKTIKKEYKI